MNRALFGAIIAVALLIGSFYAGARHGEAVRDAHYASVLAQKEADMAKLRRDARERLAAREAALQKRADEQDARITTLLRKDHDFQAWYRRRPPVDVGDLIYGVR
jgi:hypothetical protein